MKKKELAEFIERKLASEKKKLVDSIREDVTARLEPTIKTLFDKVEIVEARARNLSDSYLKALEDFGLSNDWDSTQIVRNLRDFDGWSRRRRNSIRLTVKNTVMNPHSDVYKAMLNLRKFSPQIVEIAEALIIEHEPNRKKLEDFKTLATELQSVINLAPSAKQAYKQLEALGVDMSEFKTEETLPVVVKLSVDTCLINGGCA